VSVGNTTKEQRMHKALSVEDTLRAAIQSSPLSLRELERRAGIGNGVLSRFLRGETTLMATSLSPLAAVLGLELAPCRQGEREPAGGK
jgi:transcriptional regulator with XRE-family HTH domain